MEASETQEASSASGVEFALLPGAGALPEDMMTRFEALSRAFKAEVEGLVDKEKATSKETNDQLQERVRELEKELQQQTIEAQLVVSRLHDFVSRRQPGCLGHIFGDVDRGKQPEVSTVSELRALVDAFVEVNDAERSPELEAALREIDELKATVRVRDEDLSTLHADLREARVLKSQEERDLIEFKSLREKDSELQEVNLKLAQARSQLEEMQSAQTVLSARAAQSEASLGDKARKLVELVRKLEEQTEQSRLLSNENNTLKLQLGKDSDFTKVTNTPQDPLSYVSTAGQLSEELAREQRRFHEELAVLQYKFPGLVTGSENCRGWCGVHLERQCSLYTSFLHLFQDSREDMPIGTEIEFVSKTKEVDAAWAQREEEMRDQDAAFHEREKTFTKRFEDRRLKLVEERDAKIKQLLEQTERSSSKAEKQLLMQQAKLYGQRMDAQIERAWEEQRKERDARWAEHNKAKQESRQKFKDDSLSVQQEADGIATASDRFQDMVQAKLASVEDAWHRSLDKESAVSATVLKSNDLVDCVKAAGYDRSPSTLPREGALHGGIADMAEVTEHVVKHRVALRKWLRDELQEQSFQQIRACVEKFVQKEGAQHRAGAPSPQEEEKPPEYSQAATLKALLQARQHRVVGDTIRRQYHDFLLILRLTCLAAARLLPAESRQTSLKGSADRLDLPPVPPELVLQASAVLEAVQPTQSDDGACGSLPHEVEAEASQCEERFMYDSLMRRLLEQVLTPLHAEHREELLALKRAHAREIRSVLQRVCQVETAAVDTAIKADLDEYRAQIKAKLLSDCEYHINEERRQLNEQVEDNLALHMRTYERQAADEERAALKERRKFLTERLVVMQSQGALSPGDKAVMQHLRTELRACELRYEMREQELLTAGGGADASSARASRTGSNSASEAAACNDAERSRGAGGDAVQVANSAQTTQAQQAAVVQEPQHRSIPTRQGQCAAGTAHGYQSAPVPPVGPAPPQRRPSSRTSSPSPAAREQQQQRSTAFPIGRVSGAYREPAVLSFPASPSQASNNCPSSLGDRCAAPPQPAAPSGVPHPAPPSGMVAGMQPPVPSPRRAPPRAPESPSFGGADGAAGFGRLDGYGVEEAKSMVSWEASKLHGSTAPQCTQSMILPHSTPLYEWPFEVPGPSATLGEGVGGGHEFKGHRSLSAPVARASMAHKIPGEMLPPLSALKHAASSHAVLGPAYGHQQASPGSNGLKIGARGIPPLLPPVSTPRGQA